MTGAAAEPLASSWVSRASTPVLANRPLHPDTDPARLSCFADDRWDLSPAVFAPHMGRVTISFAAAHPDFRVVLKRLCWLMLNYDGDHACVGRSAARPAVLTVCSEAPAMRAFTDWLAARGRTRFDQADACDLDGYLDHVKAAELAHDYKEDLLGAVIRIWGYRSVLDEPDRLPAAPPWGGERLHRLLEGRRNTALTTPRIPPATMNALLAWALRFVEDFAGDITAGFQEARRLADRAQPGPHQGPRYRRTSGEVPADLRGLLRAFSRLGIALPGLRCGPGAELDYHFGYLARLLATSDESLRTPTCRQILRDSGIPLREGAPLLLPPTGTVDGRPWRENPIEEPEARSLARHLMAACFIVVAYLSGMRPGEVLALERGCLHHDRSTGLLLVRGRHWKGVRDDSGTHLPQGEIRPDPWVVAEPVATAIAVLEALHEEQLLFPNRLGGRPQKAVGTGYRFRDGRARTSTAITRDLNGFIDWVNTYCTRTNRNDPIPPDPDNPTITPRRLRRTLAWFIARKPRGIVAAAIQYGHLKVQMTLGYAGTYASGFPDDLAFEEWLAQLDLLSDAHDRLDAGEHVSGPAAEEYRHRVRHAQRFAGRTLTTHRDARTLLASPELQVYPGTGMTCVLDPQRAACRLARDDTDTRRTPDLSDCRPTCANIARTDRDIDVLRAAAERLAECVADPFAPAPRLARERHELDRLRGLIAAHDKEPRDDRP